MKRYRIAAVATERYPVVTVTFEDGLSGEVDLSEDLARPAAFTPLLDRALFELVELAEGGHAWGWNLDQVGAEIDFCADATRIDIEAQAVHRLAAEYRRQRVAAE